MRIPYMNARVLCPVLVRLILLAVMPGMIFSLLAHDALRSAHAVSMPFHIHRMQTMPVVHTLGKLPSNHLMLPQTGQPVLLPCQSNSNPRPVLCYGPAQIQQAYHINDLLKANINGQGTTIAIIDAYGSPTIQKDLQAFDEMWGLPDPQLTVIAPDGQPKTDANWIPETTLDVEWAHALAPQANITLVVAKSSEDVDLYSATRYAIEHDLGDVMSLSFGENELCADPALRAAQHQAFAKAQAKGITVLVATGDSGSAQPACDNLSFQEGVSFPASDPLVTAVGGTALKADAETGRYIRETAWNEADDVNKATGGGYSAVYARPDYQQGIAEDVTGRALPDIALNASVNGGVVIYQTEPISGRLIISIMGGTSVATPELAGLLADGVQMAGHRLGAINPALYKLGASKEYSHLMNDISAGNNVLTSTSIAGYPAARGWDPTTGWGTPRQAMLFLKALIAAQ